LFATPIPEEGGAEQRFADYAEEIGSNIGSLEYPYKNTWLRTLHEEKAKEGFMAGYSVIVQFFRWAWMYWFNLGFNEVYLPITMPFVAKLGKKQDKDPMNYIEWYEQSYNVLKNHWGRSAPIGDFRFRLASLTGEEGLKAIGVNLKGWEKQTMVAEGLAQFNSLGSGSGGVLLQQTLPYPGYGMTTKMVENLQFPLEPFEMASRWGMTVAGGTSTFPSAAKYGWYIGWTPLTAKERKAIAKQKIKDERAARAAEREAALNPPQPADSLAYGSLAYGDPE